MIEICSVRSGHTHSSGLPKTRFCCHALKTRRSVNSRCCMLHVERCQSWNVGENKGGTPGAGATRLVVIYIYLAIIYIYILYYIYLLFKYIVQCINLFDILYIYMYICFRNAGYCMPSPHRHFHCSIDHHRFLGPRYHKSVRRGNLMLVRDP